MYAKIVSFKIIVYVQSGHGFIVHCKGHTTIQVLQLLVCRLQTYTESYCGISILLRLPRLCVCLCAKCDKFLPVRSHFDTKRPVNFFHIATFQSATFGRPLFAFVLCVLRQKIIKKPKMLGKRIDRRNRWSGQREEMNATLYCRLITRLILL